MSYKPPSPFKLIHYQPDHLGIGEFMGMAFEAEFDLPTDSTPNTFNKLVVRCVLENDTDEEIEIYVINRSGWTGDSSRTKDRIISSSKTNIENVAGILYGFASIRTRNYLYFKR